MSSFVPVLVLISLKDTYRPHYPSMVLSKTLFNKIFSLQSKGLLSLSGVVCLYLTKRYDHGIFPQVCFCTCTSSVPCEQQQSSHVFVQKAQEQWWIVCTLWLSLTSGQDCLRLKLISDMRSGYCLQLTTQTSSADVTWTILTISVLNFWA